MLEREISRAEVKQVIKDGTLLESYDEDKPFPSKLLFLVVNKRPIHIVIAKDILTNECYIITAYEPTISYFQDDFMRRKI